MVTYTWQIQRLDTYPTIIDSTGKTFYDVVYAVQWQLTATNELGKSVWIWDSMGLNIDLSATLVPRHELTDDIIIPWIQAGLGAAKILKLQTQLDAALVEIV